MYEHVGGTTGIYWVEVMDLLNILRCTEQLPYQKELSTPKYQ